MKEIEPRKAREPRKGMRQHPVKSFWKGIGVARGKGRKLLQERIQNSESRIISINLVLGSMPTNGREPCPKTKIGFVSPNESSHRCLFPLQDIHFQHITNSSRTRVRARIFTEK